MYEKGSNLDSTNLCHSGISGSGVLRSVNLYIKPDVDHDVYGNIESEVHDLVYGSFYTRYQDYYYYHNILNRKLVGQTW